MAESVLIAGMFVSIGPELVAIERRKGNNDKADAYQKDIDAMTAAIEKDGWDGEWFVRAYDAMGNKVGSKECEDGKIFIESQGYCVMAGVGVKNGMAEKALESVHKILETEHGIVLLQPAYKEYHLELGEVSSYPPGYKENAGIFCHNNPWIIAAETVVGHGDRACLQPDDRRQGREELRPGQEQLADRYRGLELLRDQQLHPGRQTRLGRPEDRSLRAPHLGRLQG